MTAGTNDLPGPLIGTGRAADVYDIGGGKVLRRYRSGFDCAAEADLMRYLRGAGYPVPEIFDGDGPCLVMQRLSGIDMLADLGKRPWLVRRHAQTLASLHDLLHVIAPPPGLPEPVGPGNSVLHMDFHPGNVMLTSDGPMVIDWSNGVAGPAGADIAMAQVILASSEVDNMPPPVRPIVSTLQRSFVRHFLAAAQADPAPYLPAVIRQRLSDPNVRPSEAARLHEMLPR